jgi:hypothetical protein
MLKLDTYLVSRTATEGGVSNGVTLQVVAEPGSYMEKLRTIPKRKREDFL